MRIEGIKLVEQCQNAINSLVKIEKLNFEITEVQKSELTIESTEIPEDLKIEWEDQKYYSNLIKETILKFAIEIEYEEKFYPDFKDENLTSNEFYLAYLLPEEVEKRFYEFLMIANISFVGGLHFGIGYLRNSKLGFKQLQNLNFRNKGLYEYALEKQWPKFENLEIRKTWEWYSIKVNPKGIDHLSSSKLSRAVYAFSYLQEDSHFTNKLFWTMCGLEAIYVEGKTGIKEQLKNKSQLYLGELEMFKKRISRMYDFRSAFVHGSKNFPSFFHIHDGDKTFEVFTEEQYEVLYTAQSILLATLQKMAKENRDRLTFKYIIEN